MEATILLERSPDFEIIDGLIYITDHIGSLTIRRCMRPSAFRRSYLQASELLAKWQVEQLGKVAALPCH
jgi:hypothetical protein